MGKKWEKYRKCRKYRECSECWKYRAATAVFLAAGGFALLLAARKVPGFAEWYSKTVYPVLVNTIGRFFGIFPFSVVEIGLYLGLLFLAGLLVRYWSRPGLLLQIYGLVLSALFFSYSAACGVNYYRKPFSASLEFEQSAVSLEDLRALCAWLTEQVNTSRRELEQAEGIYEDMPGKGRAAMYRLSESYPVLRGFYPAPKPVFVSWILSIQQCAGVYAPFTVEANYNRDMVSYNIPHTICHELSHLRGFMREDEANFIGYLACLESEDADFRYSGYLLGWIYAGNALAKEDFEEYVRLYGLLDDGIKKDLEENGSFWEQYEGRAAEAADRVNDAYLKANGQSEGILTYGRVVDLMILDFVKKHS